MMKKLLLPFFLFLMQNCFSQPSFQLAPPILKYKSAFFSGTTSFVFIFNQPGAEVRYTLNGNEPTENSKFLVEIFYRLKQSMHNLSKTENKSARSLSQSPMNIMQKVKQIFCMITLAASLTIVQVAGWDMIVIR